MEEGDGGSPSLHIIDIEAITSSMGAELETLRPLSGGCSIYRVPGRLRQINEKAYTPRTVSIGPIHHKKTELKEMEEHKKRYLQDFLQLTKISSNEYLRKIKEVEARLRSCYAEAVQLGDEEFVKMVLVDSAFVIMVFLRNSNKHPKRSSDRIFNRPWLITDVMLDMALLENQIPFFILDQLFKLSNIEKSLKGLSMVELAYEFFKGKWNPWMREDILGQLKGTEIEHFVHFLRCFQPPTKPQFEAKTLKSMDTPTATQLHQAGVKFRRGSSSSIFDVRFSNGVLEIPSLRVFDETELLFRNLQAYEQCHCRDNHFSDYIAFMNLLVNASQDVDLLIKHQIIENWGSNSEQVASLFNNLAKENIVIFDEFYWAGLIDRLNAYCQQPWHEWRATLKREYFTNPWSMIAFVSAFIGLVLTLIQTVCSILQSLPKKGSKHG